ncbi:MAG: VCBS repeat-containing protein [Ignavibacteriales bacterium]|nr:VCBS repeat-containing protein [Ignavibacteriales bacterium]
MKKILVCCLLFLVGSFSYTQSKYQTKEEKLQQLKTREDIKVTEVEKDLLKLEYPNGKVLYKNIGDYKPPTANNIIYSPTFDSTIIDLSNIDTTLYSGMYSYWQEVPLTNFDFSHILVGDVNNNGKTELYGARKFFETDSEPISIYELNDQDEFVFKYQYDSADLSWNIYDIDKDDNQDFHVLGYGGDQRIFSKESDTSFAKELNFSFYYPAQLSDQTLADFDSDQYTDLLFAKSGLPNVHIFEYNPNTNNFDSVYRFDVNEAAPFGNSGFSVADFDIDNKTEMVFGTMKGNVFVLENEGDNQYNNSWQGTVDIYNAYIHTWTHDIDNNGKPEFWVLGDGFINGATTTRITIFENNGDDSYQVVGKVDLLGVFSFYAGTMQAVDIDNDGVDEVAICIDDNFLVLKFNGSRDHHTYELYYIKKNEAYPEGEWTTYFGGVVNDLLDNDEFEILISMSHTIEVQPPIYNLSRAVTKIYRHDSTTIVYVDVLSPITIKLYQNYPNPFNPTTNVRFTIGSSISTSIKIYNILGKEIRTLLEKNLLTGEHSVQWDGKDDRGNLLPGGVYFIQMIAGSYQKTIKTILLK